MYPLTRRWKEEEMKPPGKRVGLLVVIAVLAWGPAGQGQPTIPKQQIPPDIPAEVKQRIEGLYSSDPQQRASAAMGLLGGPEEVAPAIPFLIAMLHDDAVLHDEAELTRLAMISSYARVFSFPNTPGEHAAETLARIGGRAGNRVMDALMVPLKDKDSMVRANAIRALGEMLWQMGQEQRESIGVGRAVEPLIAALEDKPAKSRRYAAVVLRHIGNPRAVEPLMAALQKDPSPEVRAAAAAALGAVKDPRPVGLLIATLENASEAVEVRVSAAEALGGIGDRRAVEPLIKTLKDKDPLVRGAALTVADMIPDFRRLRPLLVDALQDPEWRVRVRATLAAVALGKLKDPAALEVLTTALHDEHPNVRAAATRSLAELKDPRAVPPLAATLREDDNSYVRWHAAMALEQFDDPRAVGPLTAALKDEDELVRTTARRALEKIKKATESRQI
jgi:HEAT repeat protein